MSHPNGPGAGVIAIRQAAGAARQGMAVEQYAKHAKELTTALETFRQPEINIS